MTDMSTPEGILDWLGDPEDLDPELLPYYEEEGVLGAPSIRHPLVYSVIHSPQMNGMVNRSLRAKKERIGKAVTERDWSAYIWMHERPYRLDAFADICQDMTDEDYWHHLGSIWTDTENMWQNRGLWELFLTNPERWPHRHHMMTPEEQAHLADDLDDEFTVYRGFAGPGTAEGFSWTHNPVVAKWFARRFASTEDTPMVATGRVRKMDVVAYFDGRSEYEVVVLPDHVHDLRVDDADEITTP